MGETPAIQTQNPEQRPHLAQQIRQIFVVGVGLMGGGGGLMVIAELLRSEPDKGFGLLHAWGPWFIVALFSAWAVDKWVMRLFDILQRTGEGFVTELKRLAVASEGQAAAQQQTANKDDRQMQEIQTLTSYTSQEMERNAATLRQIVETQAENAEAIKQILAELRRPQLDIQAVVAEAVVAYRKSEVRVEGAGG